MRRSNPMPFGRSRAILLALLLGVGALGQEATPVKKSVDATPARKPVQPRLPGVGSWLQYRGDLQGTGVSHSPRPAYKGVKWKYFAAQSMTTVPAVAGGKVLVATEYGFVHCIDAQTGAKAWVTRCGSGKATDGISLSSPLVHDGKVWIGNRAGHLFVLALDDGKILHDLELSKESIYASPRGGERGIVVSDTGGSVHCFDPVTAKHKWRFEALREIGASASILGDSVYVPCKDRQLYVLDYATGVQREAIEIGGTTHCTPSLGLGYAFLITGARKCTAVDLIGKSIAWEVDANADDKTAAACADGVVYFPLGQYIWALEGSTGKKLWEFKTRGKLTAPVVNGDELLVADKAGVLYVVDRKSGTETFKLELGEPFVASPTVVDGVVYLAADGHQGVYVYAVE